MDPYERQRKKHNELKANQKKARIEKTERIKKILLQNKEKGNCNNTNIPGYALDENENVIKIT